MNVFLGEWISPPKEKMLAGKMRAFRNDRVYIEEIRIVGEVEHE